MEHIICLKEVAVFNSAASKAHFTFKLSGTSLETRVVHFGVSEQISGIFVSQLSLATEQEIKSFDKIIGKESLLTIVNSDPLSGGDDRYVHGVVQSFRYSGRNGRFYLYVADVVPTLWQFSLRKNFRIFQVKKAQEIVKQVLEDGGINSERYRFALVNQARLRKFCVQYGETDLEFITRILEEEGIFYFFEHYKDKHVMVMSDNPAVHIPIQGNKFIACNSHGGLVAEKESISAFTYSQHQTPDAYTHRNFNFKNPPLDLTANRSGGNQGKFEIYDYPALHVEQGRGNDLAAVRIEQLTTLQKLGKGKSSSYRLTPGYTFTLTGHDSKSLNDNYLLIRVAHSGSQPQSLEEKAGGGAEYGNSFTVIPATTAFRPPLTMYKPVVKGIQTATVVGPKGEEIHTDDYGRVRVQFHWDREGKRDEKSSCWIRCGQAWGGLSRGGQFIPRIGDEVLVDFVDGDPDRPIVTGSVYNSDNMPINSLKKSITQSGFKTKTHKGEGFHELRFDDAKGREEIYLQSEKDLNILVKNRKGQTVGGDSGAVIGKNCDLSVGGDSFTNIKGKSTEIAKEILVAADDKLTIVSGASSIVITPGSIEFNSPIVKVNCGGGAPMPQKRPVSGCTGKGSSSGGGGGGGSSVTSKPAAKSASIPGAAKPDDTWKAGPVQDRIVETPTAGGSGWTEIPPGDMPAMKQNTSGLGDLVSSGSSSPLLKGVSLPKTADIVSSATSTLPGDLVNSATRIASVAQNPESIKDAAVAAGRSKVAQTLDKAKGVVLEESGIGAAQGAIMQTEKPGSLLGNAKINPDDLMKKM